VLQLQEGPAALGLCLIGMHGIAMGAIGLTRMVILFDGQEQQQPLLQSLLYIPRVPRVKISWPCVRFGSSPIHVSGAFCKPCAAGCMPAKCLPVVKVHLCFWLLLPGTCSHPLPGQQAHQDLGGQPGWQLQDHHDVHDQPSYGCLC
jgi:hypothetical protein